MRWLVPCVLGLTLALCRFDASAQDSLPSRDEIATKLKEAQEMQLLSDNPQIIYEQLRDVTDEIQYLQSSIAQQNFYQQHLDAISNFDKQFTALVDSVKSAVCPTLPDETYNLFGSTYDSADMLPRYGYGTAVDDLSRAFNQLRADTCENTKVNFSGEKKDKVLAIALSLRTAVEEKVADLEQRRRALSDVVAELQKKREEMSVAMKGAKTKEQLGENLWLVIAVLAAVGILTILAVRLFESDIQVEWVASGQITQFVTVMILLSAILGLGLSDVLKEETLGTLLGGVSGYVLSQGVGRAAARAAARQARNDTKRDDR